MKSGSYRGVAAALGLLALASCESSAADHGQSGASGGAHRPWHSDSGGGSGALSEGGAAGIGGEAGMGEPPVPAHSCPAVGVWTQADYDALVAQRCTEIKGELWINPRTFWHPRSLAGLSTITSVTGDLTLWGLHSLTSLDGLQNITQVGGSLTLRELDAVTSLDGLQNLAQLGGSLVVAQTIFTSLDGFSSLRRIGGLAVADNGALTSLSALSSISGPLSSLEISGNARLESLTGLEGMTEIASGGYLSVTRNPELTSLKGLDNLRASRISVRLWRNPQLRSLEHIGQFSELTQLELGSEDEATPDPGLTSLTGLSNLTSIDGAFIIRRQSTLTSLQGLDQLRSVGSLELEETRLESLSPIALSGTISSLLVRSNASLRSLVGLGGVTTIARSLDISGNNALTSLAGLEALTQIGSAAPGGMGLSVYNDPALSSLADLAKLESIRGGGLSLNTLPALTSLAGLEAVRHVDDGLEILATGLTTLGPLLAWPAHTAFGSVTVADNARDLSAEVSQFLANQPDACIDYGDGCP